MGTKNIAYFGENIVMNYLGSAKALFESTIELVEKGSVVFKEKEVLMILMDSVIKKVNHRLLLELVRTRSTGELIALPDEYLPKEHVADSIWRDVDFDDFKGKLTKQLETLKQSRKKDHEDFQELVRNHIPNKNEESDI